MSSPIPLTILRGSILTYRVFDVAEEIDLSAVEKVLTDEAGRFGSKARLRLARGLRQALVIRNPPLRLAMGEAELRFKNELLKVEAFATLWDYGVCSIVFQIPITMGTPWSELQSRSISIMNDPAVGEELDESGRKKMRELARIIQHTLKNPREWNTFEDYVIYFLEKVDGITGGVDLLERADLGALILGESSDVLSQRSRGEIVENVFQYAVDDLVVIDWNSAVVLEPSGQRDIADVLEFALTHLLEFRFYDDMLDHRLSSLYEAIEQRKRRIWRSHYAQISREANARFIEFSEFFERVDNSLKVVGDFYLAIIFRAGLKRFRIPDWAQSVTRKVNLLARVSDLLQGEVNVHRGLTLEFIIIILIAFEIVSAIFKTL